MTWNITMLTLHLIGAGLFIFLYRGAPCWMQKLGVVGFILAMMILAIGYGMAAAGVRGYWHVQSLGFEIEHLAVILYAFRLIYQGHLEWKPSLTSSLNSSK